MAAGKLILLLVAGGLAGAAFAGLTTRSMQPFEEAPRAVSHDDRAYAGPATHSSSWLDQGLSALDSPAWPFGRGGWSQEPAPEPPPYDYGPPDDGDANYGPGGFDEGDYDQAGRPAMQAQDAGEGTGQSPGQDAASAAARSAADAAKDVIAAENTP